MSRAKWKGPFVDLCVLKLDEKRQYPNLWSRASVIPVRFSNRILCVHNGREFFRVGVIKSKAGYKLGEFSYTRKLKKKKIIKSSKLKKVQLKKK